MLSIYQKFLAAFKYEIATGEWGIQVKLASAVCVTPKYINDIKAGRKTAGQRLQVQVAKFFNYDYEHFLFLGQSLLKGETENIQSFVAFNKVAIQANLNQIINEFKEISQKHIKELYGIIDRMELLCTELRDAE